MQWIITFLHEQTRQVSELSSVWKEFQLVTTLIFIFTDHNFIEGFWILCYLTCQKNEPWSFMYICKRIAPRCMKNIRKTKIWFNNNKKPEKPSFIRVTKYKKWQMFVCGWWGCIVWYLRMYYVCTRPNATAYNCKERSGSWNCRAEWGNRAEESKPNIKKSWIILP